MQFSPRGSFAAIIALGATILASPALAKNGVTDQEAVVIVGACKPVAEFIKLARMVDFNPAFVNISFVGALAKQLGPDGKGVIVRQVVPFPWDRLVKLSAN